MLWAVSSQFPQSHSLSEISLEKSEVTICQMWVVTGNDKSGLNNTFQKETCTTHEEWTMQNLLLKMLLITTFFWFWWQIAQRQKGPKAKGPKGKRAQRQNDQKTQRSKNRPSSPLEIFVFGPFCQLVTNSSDEWVFQPIQKSPYFKNLMWLFPLWWG